MLYYAKNGNKNWEELTVMDTYKNNTRKTIVFSFDGTGNEPKDVKKFSEDESISNVLKLHILMGGGLAKYYTPSITSFNGTTQLVYYYKGVGTLDYKRDYLFGNFISKIQRSINTVFAPLFGDVRRILDEAEQDFQRSNYQKGDRIIIFGFSRGAALARKFASLLLQNNRDCVVDFLGVFDTVAAMNGIHTKKDKISSDVVFEDATLNSRIKNAVHLVSIDDNRISFTPTLINRDRESPDRILEVWFPGIHSDVGGGYWFNGLSDVTLDFMIKQCRQKVGEDVFIYDGSNEEILRLLNDKSKLLRKITPDDLMLYPLINGLMHVSSGVTAISQQPRKIFVSDNDEPIFDKTVQPLVHWSVKERFDKVVEYRPHSLRNLNFRLLLKNGKLSEPLRGIYGLRNYKM